MLLDDELSSLASRGWTKLGRGRCSVVYGLHDRVLKFVDTRDEAQLHYLGSQEIKDILGPYHPRYIKIKSNFLGLDLRNKDEFTRFEVYAGRRFYRIPKIFNGVTSKHYMSLVQDYIYDGAYSRRLEDNFCLCLDYLARICRKENYSLDISKKNLMLHEDQVIINDPFFTH